MMARIELPRALEDYFAFAETTPTREGRRFSITLPYVDPRGRVDRLQWWYHLSDGKEKVLGERALETMRAQAIERFRDHIDWWLQRTAQILCGPGPIPSVVPLGSEPAAEAPPLCTEASEATPLHGEAAMSEAGDRPTEQAPSIEIPTGKSAFG
jgi:hypothetical protein